MARAYSGQPLKQRILNLVHRKNNKECWEWQGNKNALGYGRLTVGSRRDDTRKTREAHRVSYEAFIGLVPEGKVLDHLCRNPSCANPYHLEPVTAVENIRRGNAGKIHRDKTHCPQGHEYSTNNLYKSSTKNGRNCKACMKTRSKERYWASRRVTLSHAN